MISRMIAILSLKEFKAIQLTTETGLPCPDCIIAVSLQTGLLYPVQSLLNTAAGMVLLQPESLPYQPPHLHGLPFHSQVKATVRRWPEVKLCLPPPPLLPPTPSSAQGQWLPEALVRHLHGAPALISPPGPVRHPHGLLLHCFCDSAQMSPSS